MEKEILNYWFPKDGSADYNKWFMKSQNYDKEIKKKFGKLLEQVENDKVANWINSKDTFLAYIILLDQFSRHIYRGSSKSFANDDNVMNFTDLGYNLGHFDQLHSYEFMFAFMPYMHTENSELQKKGYCIFYKRLEKYSKYKTLLDKKEYEILLSMKEHVDGHYNTLKMFGRFPKRNKAMGRESTPEEIIYLNLPEVQKRPY